jgi:hypothetical protein
LPALSQNRQNRRFGQIFGASRASVKRDYARHGSLLTLSIVRTENATPRRAVKRTQDETPP